MVALTPRDPLLQEEDSATVVTSTPQEEFAPMRDVLARRFRSTTKLNQLVMFLRGDIVPDDGRDGRRGGGRKRGGAARALVFGTPRRHIF